MRTCAKCGKATYVPFFCTQFGARLSKRGVEKMTMLLFGALFILACCNPDDAKALKRAEARFEKYDDAKVAFCSYVDDANIHYTESQGQGELRKAWYGYATYHTKSGNPKRSYWVVIKRGENWEIESSESRLGMSSTFGWYMPKEKR